MAVFVRTKAQGQLSYIGVVKSRQDSLASTPLDKTKLTFAGIEGESHTGQQRPSCSRVSSLFKKGTPIANSRQLSIMSEEELEAIAQSAHLNANQPEWWGANICIKGIADLSAIPPSSRLQFPSGATIRVDVENGPCKYSAELVAQNTGGDAKAILAAAKHNRGLVGAVEAEGEIAIGDQVELFVPETRPYQVLR